MIENNLEESVLFTCPYGESRKMANELLPKLDIKYQKRKSKYTAISLLANLIHASKENQPLAVSFNRNNYTDENRKEYRDISVDDLRKIREKLVDGGYVIKRNGYLDRETGVGRNTRLIPTPKFRELLPTKISRDLFQPNALVGYEVVKDRKTKRVVDTIKSEQTERFNGFLEGYEFSLNGKNISASRLAMFRVAHLDDDKIIKNRFYSAIQNIKSSERRNIRIDGEGLVEIDLVSHHAALAYGLENITPPNDLYGIQYWDRKTVKIATIIAFNAKDKKSGIKAISSELNLEVNKAKKLMDDVMNFHDPIRKYFFSDSGMSFMKIEGDLFEKMMPKLIRAKLPVLNIHDGWMVPVSKINKFTNILTETYLQITGQTPIYTVSAHVEINKGKIYEVPEQKSSDSDFRDFDKLDSKEEDTNHHHPSPSHTTTPQHSPITKRILGRTDFIDRLLNPKKKKRDPDRPRNKYVNLELESKLAELEIDDFWLED